MPFLPVLVVLFHQPVHPRVVPGMQLAGLRAQGFAFFFWRVIFSPLQTLSSLGGGTVAVLVIQTHLAIIRQAAADILRYIKKKVFVGVDGVGLLILSSFLLNIFSNSFLRQRTRERSMYFCMFVGKQWRTMKSVHNKRKTTKIMRT